MIFLYKEVRKVMDKIRTLQCEKDRVLRRFVELMSFITPKLKIMQKELELHEKIQSLV